MTSPQPVHFLLVSSLFLLPSVYKSLSSCTASLSLFPSVCCPIHESLNKANNVFKMDSVGFSFLTRQWTGLADWLKLVISFVSQGLLSKLPKSRAPLFSGFRETKGFWHHKINTYLRRISHKNGKKVRMETVSCHTQPGHREIKPHLTVYIHKTLLVSCLHLHCLSRTLLSLHYRNFNGKHQRFAPWNLSLSSKSSPCCYPQS